MRLVIDTDTRTIEQENGGEVLRLPLFSKEAFELISREWVRVGWDQRYAYTFSWLGRPIIQLPEDMVRTQEVIHRVQPDVIVETGVAHGGSLVYYATLCKALERGHVVGVDIEIRPHNREAIEAHPLSSLITLIEGDSVSPQVVGRVTACIKPGDTVLVILDSCHTRQHVLSELRAYAGFVTPGSYIVATDGIMHDLADVPNGDPSWDRDNPMAAAAEFAAERDEFVLEQPAWPFNESGLTRNITHWPGAWLRRR